MGLIARWKRWRMEKAVAAPGGWIGAADKRWLPESTLAGEDGLLPDVQYDPVNPELPRDMREGYKLVSQLGSPAIRAARAPTGMLLLWKEDVERWRAWQLERDEGEVEFGSIR